MRGADRDGAEGEIEEVEGRAIEDNVGSARTVSCHYLLS